MAPLTYDYLVLALGAEVNFFGTEGAAEHAFPHVHAHRRGAAQGARARAVGGRRQGPEPARGRRAEHRRRRRWADGRRERRRDRRALPRRLREGLPGRPAGEGARSCSSRRGPEIFAMFKPNLRAYTERRSRSAASRSSPGRRVASVAPHPRHAEVGHGDRRAHARVGRGPAGEPARPVARARARARQPDRRRSRTSRFPVTPRCTPSATSPRSRTRRPSRSCRSSARSRSSRASTPARRSRGASRARSRSRSSTGTRGRWRRSDAAPRSCRCSAGGR